MAQLSNRYATALFQLSLERNQLQENLDQALFLRDTLKDEKCQSVITHPRIKAAEKKAFFDEAFSGQVSADLLGFLHLAVEKNRERYIVAVLSEFIDLSRQHMRKTTAQVVSAVPLTKEQVSALAALLSKKLNKQVDIAQKVDSSVIGGLYIQADGYFIDRTVRTRLKEMQQSFKDAL